MTLVLNGRSEPGRVIPFPTANAMGELRDALALAAREGPHSPGCRGIVRDELVSFATENGITLDRTCTCWKAGAASALELLAHRRSNAR